MFAKILDFIMRLLGFKKVTPPTSPNNKFLQVLTELEGCKLKAYKDPIGLWTIGVGHLISRGQDPRLLSLGIDTNDYIGKLGSISLTSDQALQLLAMDLEVYKKAVERLVKIPLKQNEYDALVSFTFNLGEPALKESTLLKKLNNKTDLAEVAQEFLRWDRAGGRSLSGLTVRRAVEASIFVGSQEAPQELLKIVRSQYRPRVQKLLDIYFN